MTQYARVLLSSHLGIHDRRMSEGGGRVAGQAEQAHIAVLQHVRIGPAVRDVARRATFRLHYGMLKYKWSLFIGVAFETDEVAGR
jgi:hypothetical protein